MAANYLSFASAAADDLACPICFQIYVTPHEPKNLLKCSHMCCSVCLKKMTEGGFNAVKCPQCNKVSNLPEEGVDGMITSLTVKNLAEKHPEGIKQRKEHMLQEVEQQTYLMAEKLKEIVKSEQKIQASIEQEVREVEKAVETMMTQAQDMIKQIRELSQPKLTEARKEKVRLEQQMKDIEKSQSELKTITDGKFQTETDTLVKNVEKLKINAQTIYRQEDYSTAKFVAQDIQLGRIVKPRILEQVHEFGSFNSACGIASKLNGTLAVADMGSNPPKVHVYIYDNDEYKKQFQFNVEQAKKGDLPDIAVSADDKYLLTRGKAGFEMYSSDGKHQKAMEETIDPEHNVVAYSNSITTTRDGRILVGSAIEGKVENVITVHDTAGKMIKTIPINTLPIRIADIFGVNVAVTSLVDELPKVCVYNLETGKETKKLDIPDAVGVCHDEESDCLLIGRATQKDEDGFTVDGSCVIEQYCCVTGKLVATLAHGLVLPAAMTKTQDGMLAVADINTVKVYQMK